MTRQYIGARYVPKFADPIAWDKTNSYEALTIVTYLNNSYTSKKPVPPNIEITDKDYWVLTGNYNGQVEEYRKETAELKAELALSQNAVTPEMYGAVGDGVTDDTKAITDAIESSDVVILKNIYKVSTTDSKMISSKQTTVNICIEVPSNKTIIVTGEVLTNDNTIIFYSEDSTNVNIIGGRYTFNNISSNVIYVGKEVLCLVNSSNCSIRGIWTNEAVICTIACKRITTDSCICERTSSTRKNAGIGYHTTNDSIISNCYILGLCNDGDILLFSSSNCRVLGNHLDAKYYNSYIDLGAQGICVDTVCYNIIVSNNYATGYYHPIDVKSDARYVNISDNSLYANKCGITVRKGEQTGGQLNTQSNIIIANNIIDIGGGNGATDSLPGTGGLYTSDITSCGIYITDTYSAQVIGNQIGTSKRAICIGIFGWNNYEDLIIEENVINQRDTKSNSYMSGIFIACKNGEKINRTNIKNNTISSYSTADDSMYPFYFNNINDLYVKGNMILSGTTDIAFSNVDLLHMCSNVITENARYLFKNNPSNAILIGNEFYTYNNFGITRFNSEAGISVGNVITYSGTNMIGTGCKTNNDVVEKRDE